MLLQKNQTPSKPLTKIDGTKVKADPLRDRFNKIVIIFVILVVFVTLSLRLLTSIFLDLGFFDGQSHTEFWKIFTTKITALFTKYHHPLKLKSTPGIWEFPKELQHLADNTDVNSIFLNNLNHANAEALVRTLKGLNPINTGGTPRAIASGKDIHSQIDTWVELALRAQRRPNVFWSLTQFTWQTTIIVFLIFVFRLFLYNGTNTKSLKWINQQQTLTLLTIYDSFVGIVFWAGLYSNGFAASFSNDRIIYNLQMVTTILVHAVIPLLLLTYATTHVLIGRTSKKVSYKYVFIGSIYPVLYGAFYIIMSYTWTDPYPITSIKSIFDNHNTAEIWKMPTAMLSIFMFLGLGIAVHNKLIKYNRYTVAKIKNN